MPPALPPLDAAAPARERILHTAARLFYGEGIRATGIDRIIAESGAAKMSFYRHFPSKADLIDAFLRLRHDLWMDWFRARLAAHVERAGPGLARVADVLGEWFREEDFRGCAFINAVAEESPGGRQRDIALAHKAELREVLREAAAGAGSADPEGAADLALLVMEGAIVRAQMSGDPAVADQARDLLGRI